MNFYRNFALLFFTLILNCTIYSQEISYNIFSGANLSNTKYTINNYKNNNSGAGYNARLAFHLGLGIDIPLDFTFKNKTNLSVEIQYSEQGDSFFIGSKRYLDEINQLNIPIKIKTELLKNLNFGLGGYVGYLLNVEEYLEQDEYNYNNFDLGLAGSIEYKFLENLRVKIQFLYGLKDVLDRDFMENKIKFDRYNRVLQFGLNYKF